MIKRVTGTGRLFCTLCAASAALLITFSSGTLAAQDAGIQSSSAQAASDDARSQDIQAEDSAPVPVGAVGGMGDINLFPRRIVLDRRQRTETVGLYNRVPAEGEYEVTVRDMVMTPDGGLVVAEDPRAAGNLERLQAASAMLRWSPRRVRLLGNEAQTVRVMARPPADLPDGEYRSHFTVISVPQDVDDGFSIADAAGDVPDGAGIGVRIRPRFALSIPVIVRIGETTLDVGMELPAFIDTDVGTAIRLTLTRAGTRSAFGDLIITASGIDEPIALARGIGIYPEIDSRIVEIVLRSDFDEALLQSGMVLTAKFVDDDFEPGETLVSQDFRVP